MQQGVVFFFLDCLCAFKYLFYKLIPLVPVVRQLLKAVKII